MILDLPLKDILGPLERIPERERNIVRRLLPLAAELPADVEAQRTDGGDVARADAHSPGFKSFPRRFRQSAQTLPASKKSVPPKVPAMGKR